MKCFSYSPEWYQHRKHAVLDWQIARCFKGKKETKGAKRSFLKGTLASYAMLKYFCWYSKGVELRKQTVFALDTVPDAKTLEGLLTYEVARVLVDASSNPSVDYSHCSVDCYPSLASASVGLRRNPGDEFKVSRLLNSINEPNYLALFDKAAEFADRLSSLSQQIPNLTKARFGTDLLEMGAAVHDLRSLRSPATLPHEELPLVLRARYVVDVKTGRLHRPTSPQ